MVDRLIASLVAITLAFSAASLLIIILREPCRRLAGSVLTYWLWLLAPLAIVAALLPALPHQAAQIMVPAAVQPIAAFAAAAAAPSPDMAVTDQLTWKDLAPYLIGAWGFGLLAFVCRVALLQRRFMEGLGRLTRDPGRANVFFSEKSGISPSVIGTLRSRIVLPADFARFYGADEQTLIMAHERTHVSERHPTAGALGVLILAVQWFNPLAHLAMSLFRIDQELACDAAVVTAHPASRAAYAKAMLKARIGAGTNPPLAYCWLSRLSLPMKHRIGLLKSLPPSPQRRMTAITLLALVASAGTVTAYAMVPHPEISLSFGAALSPAMSAPLPIRPSASSTVKAAKSPEASAAVAFKPAISPITVVRGGLTNVPQSPEKAPTFDVGTFNSSVPQQVSDALMAARAQGANVPIPVAETAVLNENPVTQMTISMKPGVDVREIFRIIGAVEQGNSKVSNASTAPEVGS